MKEVLIPASAAYLLCGLVWRPIPKKGWAEHVRQIASERGATSFVQIGKAGSDNAFFATFSEHETARKHVFSLCSVLAKHAGDAPAAVILNHEDMYAVGCVNKGTPIIDQIFKDRKEAVNALKTVSQNLGIKPKVNFQGEPNLEFVDGLAVRLLGPKKGRVSASKEIPKSLLPSFVMAAVAIGGTYWWYDNDRKETARIEAERLAAEREADPIPKYMRQLSMDEPFFALTDNTALKMLGDIAVIAQRPKGWVFDEANCEITKDTHQQQCQLKFKRNSGIYSDLKQELSKFKLRYSFPADLNTAVAYLDYKEESFKFSEYRKSAEEFLEQDLGDKAQDWLTAGLGVEITQPSLWPQAPGVPQNFRHPLAKMAGEVKVSKLPLYLVSDLLNTKPANSFVKSFKIKTQSLNKELDAEVSMDLRYYVQQ